MEVILKIIMFFMFFSGTLMIFEPVFYGGFIYFALKDKKDFDSDKYKKVMGFLIVYIVLISIMLIADFLGKTKDVFWWATGLAIVVGLIIGYIEYSNEVNGLQNEMISRVYGVLTATKVDAKYHGFLKKEKVDLINKSIDELNSEEEDYVDDNEKYMFKMLIKPNKFALFDFLERLKVLRNGGDEKLTICEIVTLALDLDSAKRKLPKDLFNKVVKQYLIYAENPENKILRPYDSFTAIKQILLIQKEFEKIIGYKISPEGEILYKIENFESDTKINKDEIEIDEFGNIVNKADEDFDFDDEDK